MSDWRYEVLRQAALRMDLKTPNRKKTVSKVAAFLGVQKPKTKAEQYVMLANFVKRPDAPAMVYKEILPTPPSRKRKFIESTKFLSSIEWRKLRMVVLTKRGARCECCGATPKDGRVMNVDHIKPRKFHPELALVEDNLQILCDVCNHGKGNWDETDWRDEKQTERALEIRPIWSKDVN